MKPILVRVRDSLNASIEFDKTEYDYFYNPFHYHPEFELTLIVKSFGRRRIGDNIENFSEGDLVLVGSNLPHVWKNDPTIFGNNTKMKAQAICVKFLPDFAGKEFLERQEMKRIKTVLEEKASLGMKLVGHLRNKIEKIMLKLPELDETDRFIQLLQILNLIAKSNEYQLLSSLNYRNTNLKNAHRINIILDYIMEHYDEDLKLENIAGLVNMNKNAFCRFFKKGTHKTLYTVINEVRIGKACQQLAETDMNVLQVCYASGYNNISNFNKAFKAITSITPLAYRKKMII
ncbi:MAG TPA: AraC family transcriptional regulator [Bacteroidales bacterium]|nr:AraC family transcriptional regulator [Bacteroidales bacterium]